MLIRPATAQDAGAVAWVHEVARAAYYAVDPPPAAQPERVEIWRTVLGDSARATVWCAERQGVVVGFLSFGPPIHPSEADPNAVELHALYVLPDHWDAGVGSALYARFEDQLRTLPGAVGVLDVWDGNHRAIAFYERRGWTRDGRSRAAPDGTAYVGMLRA